MVIARDMPIHIGDIDDDLVELLVLEIRTIVALAEVCRFEKGSRCKAQLPINRDTLGKELRVCIGGEKLDR